MVRVHDLPLADWHKLAKFKKLEHLHLARSFAPQLTDDHLIALSKLDFPHLRCVQLRGASQVTDKGIKALTSFPSIDDLILPGVSITDQGMETIATGFPQLHLLILEDCQLITPKGYLALAASPTLKWLTLTLGPLSQADIEHIILNLPNITNWTISDPNDQLNHGSLRSIATKRQTSISVINKNRSSRAVFRAQQPAARDALKPVRP
jgi:hypothetical protein